MSSGRFLVWGGTQGVKVLKKGLGPFLGRNSECEGSKEGFRAEGSRFYGFLGLRVLGGCRGLR